MLTNHYRLINCSETICLCPRLCKLQAFRSIRRQQRHPNQHRQTIILVQHQWWDHIKAIWCPPPSPVLTISHVMPSVFCITKCCVLFPYLFCISYVSLMYLLCIPYALLCTFVSILLYSFFVISSSIPSISKTLYQDAYYEFKCKILSERHNHRLWWKKMQRAI